MYMLKVGNQGIILQCPGTVHNVWIFWAICTRIITLIIQFFIYWYSDILRVSVQSIACPDSSGHSELNTAHCAHIIIYRMAFIRNYYPQLLHNILTVNSKI